jgi:hypothetical protein
LVANVFGLTTYENFEFMYFDLCGAPRAHHLVNFASVGATLKRPALVALTMRLHSRQTGGWFLPDGDVPCDVLEGGSRANRLRAFAVIQYIRDALQMGTRRTVLPLWGQIYAGEKAEMLTVLLRTLTPSKKPLRFGLRAATQLARKSDGCEVSG